MGIIDKVRQLEDIAYSKTHAGKVNQYPYWTREYRKRSKDLWLYINRDYRLDYDRELKVQMKLKRDQLSELFGDDVKDLGKIDVKIDTKKQKVRDVIHKYKDDEECMLLLERFEQWQKSITVRETIEALLDGGYGVEDVLDLTRRLEDDGKTVEHFLELLE